MNYIKIYESLIQEAKSENRIKLRKTDSSYVYYENHHIVPRCVGGSDDEENKVLLTAREHFICHKLLTYIYEGNRKITCAFHLMTFMNKRKYGITSRDYAYAIELFRKTPISEETRIKISNANKISHKGKKLSKRHKDNIGIGNKGKTRSESFKENVGKIHKGKIYSDEIKQKMKKPKSENAKNKMSIARKGKIPWNKGLKMPPEFCNKTKEGIKEKRNNNHESKINKG